MSQLMQQMYNGLNQQQFVNMNTPDKDRIQVVKSLFLESGEYDQQVLRTFQSQYNTGVAKQFAEMTVGGLRATTGAMSQLAPHMLNVSTTPTGIVNIENGWGTRRMIFHMELATVNKFTGHRTSVVLTGYTSHGEVSRMGAQVHFDPNMKLYINSSAIISEVKQQTPMGVVPRKRITDSSHVLGPNVHKAIQKIPNQNPPPQNQPMQHHSMGFENPYDVGVFYATPANTINEMLTQRGAYGIDSERTIDLRAKSTDSNTVRSKRTSTIPTNYLSDVLYNVASNMAQVEYGGMDDESMALMNANSCTLDSQVDADPILFYLNRHTGFRHVGYVTWGELTRIINNLDETTQYTRRGAVVDMQAQMAQNIGMEGAIAGVGQVQSGSWNSIAPETIVASSIGQLVPAIMVNSMIGRISFMFTNDSIAGMHGAISTVDGQSLVDGVNLQQVSSIFEHKFMTEIAPLLTLNGTRLVTVYVMADIGTETFINIALDGNLSLTSFCVPTFCDALFTPIIAPEKQYLSNIANDLYTYATTTGTGQALGV